jgi:hypothetical protein
MPVIYTATVKARCQKQHTCLACGCVYRYPMEKTVVRSSGNPEEATQAAHDATSKFLQKEISSVPCPSCGLIQPDMVAQSKVPWHFRTALTALILLFLFQLPAGQGRAYEGTAMMLTAVAGFAALIHIFTALSNPNTNRVANQARSEQARFNGRLEMVAPASRPEMYAPPGNLNAWHGLGLLLVIGAVGAFAAPLFFRPPAPFATNPELTPSLVGPGDQVTVQFPEWQLPSLQGRWRGKPEVVVLNNEELGIASTLEAVGSNDTWNDLKVGKNDIEKTVTLSAKVNLPRESQLSGKELKLKLTMVVTCPRKGTYNRVEERQTPVTKEFSVHLADGEGLRSFRWVWWLCVAGGIFGSVFGGMLLAVQGVVLKLYAQPPLTLAPN